MSVTSSVTEDAKAKLIEAALLHVPFDGWSEASFKAAAADCDMSVAEARAIFPRGPVDMALGFHAQGDAAMVQTLNTTDLTAMRYSERVMFAVRTRLELAEHDKEAVRRGLTLFALPIYAADGAKALWQTADAIWTALGDTSDDLNWYTKRATLSGVYSSTVLYWLGDQSMDHQATWNFLERRIDGVMQFERAKSAVRKNSLLKPLLAGPDWLAKQIKAPSKDAAANLPGRWMPRS